MPFSQEPLLVQQQRFGFISTRWSQLNGLVKEWTDKAISFLMLTNAGGAVAVLSFMGASEKVREMLGPRIALCCFASGVICTGVLVAKQFHRIEGLFTHYKKDSELYLTDQMEWDTLTSRDEDRADASFMDYFWGYVPFVLFVVGCATGVISLFSGRT
jgi:hypothetical protein